MKKFTIICVMLLFVTGFTQAQTSKVVKTPFMPTFQILVKGAYSVPLSHQDFKDFTSGFPGAQLELAYDFNPCWGVYGNFSADFIPAKDRTSQLIGATITTSSSTQLSGYVGPRYYINLRSAPLWKIYLDAAVGIYSFKHGDDVTTFATNPVSTSTDSYTSVSQIGTNLGAGANVVVGSRMIVTFGARYHFVMKKTDADITVTTTTSGGTTSTTIGKTDFPERSYLQFVAGVGFRL